jgi:hypothetical protein
LPLYHAAQLPHALTAAVVQPDWSSRVRRSRQLTEEVHMSSRGAATQTLRSSLTLLALAGLLAACAAPPARGPVPPPDVELLGAGPVELPRDCQPQPDAVYRTSFVVEADGRPSRIVSESGEGCVQEALRRWVSTFEYRPVAESTPSTVDWMGVAAKRGS